MSTIDGVWDAVDEPFVRKILDCDLTADTFSMALLYTRLRREGVPMDEAEKRAVAQTVGDALVGSGGAHAV